MSFIQDQYFYNISHPFIFFRFIEERSFVSDMDMAGLAFFDECTERVEDENGENIFLSIYKYTITK